MYQDFDEGKLEPAQSQRDTELTLGPMLLLGLFFGLVLLCGLCFGLGYAMGSRGAQASQPAGQQTASSPEAGSQAKPAAALPGEAQPQSTQDGLPPAETAGANADGTAQNPGSTAAPAAAAQPIVKPALPAAVTASTPSSALMVQIAAVSRREDADVLVGALRKRGYAVTAMRDDTDGQFHVRIGPFANRNDAYATRQKLLNDGYNAIVQP